MWCPNCQSDQQAVDTAQGTRCRNCNETLRPSYSTSSLRDARDIIAKWSSSDLLDQISALPQLPEMKQREPQPEQSDSSAQGGDKITTSPAPSTPVSATRTDTDQQIDTRPPKIAPAEITSVDVAAEALSDNAAGRQTSLKADRTADEAPKLQQQPAVEATGQPEFPSKATKQQSQETSSLKPAMASSPAASTSSSQATRAESEPADQPSSRVKPPRMDFAKAMDTTFDDLPRRDQPAPEIQERNRRLQLRNEQRRKQRSRKAQPKAEPKGIENVKRKLRVDSLDPVVEDTAPAQTARNSGGGRIQSNSPQGGVRQRIDAGQPIDQTLSTGDSRARTHTRPRQRYIDEPHGTGIRGPHFEVTAPRRSNLTSMTGQFLAYIGVLGLTVGTAMVIYGHFGGHSQYTPTGWLVTTVAQMMLFLGVINLVSGGIEQNNDDVSARINHIGEQLLRIEQVTEEAVRGPKINPRRYADNTDYVDEHDRESVTVGERR